MIRCSDVRMAHLEKSQSIALMKKTKQRSISIYDSILISLCFHLSFICCYCVRMFRFYLSFRNWRLIFEGTLMSRELFYSLFINIINNLLIINHAGWCFTVLMILVSFLGLLWSEHHFLHIFWDEVRINKAL